LISHQPPYKNSKQYNQNHYNYIEDNIFKC
jgi:hypothetical protein